MRNVIYFIIVLGLVACSGQEGPQPNERRTPEIAKGALVTAVARGEYEKVLRLLDQGADVNEDVGSTGREITPLLAAIALNKEEIAKLLLYRGAATHPVFEQYTARDFHLFLQGDGGSLAKMLVQAEFAGAVGGKEGAE